MRKYFRSGRSGPYAFGIEEWVGKHLKGEFALFFETAPGSRHDFMSG
jgi:hypothetical protein